MPAVFPQMSRDAIGTSALAEQRRFYRIGVASIALIPQCRNVIDIDVQSHS
jgi:hypothetical protein